jgi:hypothetical protein
MSSVLASAVLGCGRASVSSQNILPSPEFVIPHLMPKQLFVPGSRHIL